MQRALEIAEANLEPTDSAIGARRNNLGLVLRDLGDLEGAKTQLQRAPAITKAAYGPDHPTVATVAANLALLSER